MLLISKSQKRQRTTLVFTTLISFYQAAFTQEIGKLQFLPPTSQLTTGTENYNLTNVLSDTIDINQNYLLDGGKHTAYQFVLALKKAGVDLSDQNPTNIANAILSNFPNGIASTGAYLKYNKTNNIIEVFDSKGKKLGMVSITSLKEANPVDNHNIAELKVNETKTNAETTGDTTQYHFELESGQGLRTPLNSLGLGYLSQYLTDMLDKNGYTRHPGAYIITKNEDGTFSFSGPLSQGKGNPQQTKLDNIPFPSNQDGELQVNDGETIKGVIDKIPTLDTDQQTFIKDTLINLESQGVKLTTGKIGYHDTAGIIHISLPMRDKNKEKELTVTIELNIKNKVSIDEEKGESKQKPETIKNSEKYEVTVDRSKSNSGWDEAFEKITSNTTSAKHLSRLFIQHLKKIGASETKGTYIIQKITKTGTDMLAVSGIVDGIEQTILIPIEDTDATSVTNGKENNANETPLPAEYQLTDASNITNTGAIITSVIDGQVHYTIPQNPSGQHIFLKILAAEGLPNEISCKVNGNDCILKKVCDCAFWHYVLLDRQGNPISNETIQTFEVLRSLQNDSFFIGKNGK